MRQATTCPFTAVADRITQGGQQGPALLKGETQRSVQACTTTEFKISEKQMLSLK